MQADVKIENKQAIISVPAIDGLEGITIVFESNKHTKTQTQQEDNPSQRQAEDNKTINKQIAEATARVYLCHQIRDFTFSKLPDGIKQEAKEKHIQDAVRATDSLASWEKQPGYIRSIVAGLYAVALKEDKDKAKALIKELKNGSFHSDCDPFLALHDFMTKHGAKIKPRSDRGREICGRTWICAISCWWNDKKLTLYELEKHVEKRMNRLL